MGILCGPPPLIPSVAPPPLTPSYEKCRCHREPRLWQPYVDPTPATTRRMVMQPPRKLLDGAEAGRCNSSTMTMQPEEAGGSGWSHGVSGWCRSRLLTPQGRGFFFRFRTSLTEASTADFNTWRPCAWAWGECPPRLRKCILSISEVYDSL